MASRRQPSTRSNVSCAVWSPPRRSTRCWALGTLPAASMLAAGPVSGAGSPVGERPAVVARVESGGVPGVGGLAGAGLAGVPAVGVERGGAEKVCVVPGAALGAVDGAGPGVGHVRGPVGPDPLHEPERQSSDGIADGVDDETVVVDGGNGGDGAVDEPAVSVAVAGGQQEPI